RSNSSRGAEHDLPPIGVLDGDDDLVDGDQRGVRVTDSLEELRLVGDPEVQVREVRLGDGRERVVGERLGAVEGDLRPVDIGHEVRVVLVAGGLERKVGDVAVEGGGRLGVGAGEEHPAKRRFHDRLPSPGTARTGLCDRVLPVVSVYPPRLMRDRSPTRRGAGPPNQRRPSSGTLATRYTYSTHSPVNRAC